MLQDVLDLGDRNDDLADAAFKQSTNRDIINLFPEKVTLKLSKLPGKRREKIKDQLNIINAQVLDKIRKSEGRAKAAGTGSKAQGYGGEYSGGGNASEGGQKSQTAHSAFKQPERFDGCRVCGVLGTHCKTDLYE